MKYQKAVDPATGMIDVHHVWAIDDSGTYALVADTDAGWLDWLKADLPAQIDSLVASIYMTWTRFQQEYLSRDAAAQAFKSAGYVGDPGPWVTGFAVPAGKTNQAAADLILAQGAGLNTALSALGALRMRKYEIIMATDVTAAQTAFGAIIASINSTAATIQ